MERQADPSSWSLAGPTVAELGERALIDRIRSQLPAPPPWLIVGIGDDAAVIEPDRNRIEVVTTDALVEGVHFERRYLTAADVGWKVLAVNLSDIASMGAAPRAAVLSLALPRDMTVTDCDALVASLLALAGRHRTALIGGNITASPGPLMVDVMALGSVHRRRVLTRSGGRAGDQLFVSGSIGAAAAGLRWLRSKENDPPPNEPELAACVDRFRRPEPRVRLGMALGRTGAASACIDLSDGLAAAVVQLADASGVGAVIDAGSLPVAPGARRLFELHGHDAVGAAVTGGEDYELLAAVPARSRSRHAAIARRGGEFVMTRIGVLTPERGARLKRGAVEEPLGEGFEHFS